MLVEFTLILPVLAALIFGVIDFSSAYSNVATLRQGTRDSARQLVVANVGTDSTCTRTGVTPTPNDNTKLAICLAKNAVGLGDTDTRVKIVLPGGSYAAKQPLLLCLAHPQTSLTGFFSTIIHGTSHAKVQMRIESVTASGGPIQAVEETPLSGGNWSWCVA
jgi:hypothetical protein